MRATRTAAFFPSLGGVTRTDDVATLVVRDPEYDQGSVMIVHDYSSPGFEVEGWFPTVAEWLVAAQEGDMTDVP